MILLLFAQVALAESLFSHNLFELARVEYQRLFFFDTSAQRDLQLRLHQAMACLHENSFRAYEEVDNLLRDFPAMDTESQIVLAKELLKTGNYDLAVDVLESVNDRQLLVYSYLCNRQYAHALKEARTIDQTLANEIAVFVHGSKKSITRAMLFSAILPGTGEIYAGNVRQGIQDFLLTTLSGFILYNSVKNKKYVDAGIIFIFAFNRFYFGSISNAGRIAQSYNDRRERAYLDLLREKYFELP